jgi:sulfate/thiosulfate-binding protein
MPRWNLRIAATVALLLLTLVSVSLGIGGPGSANASDAALTLVAYSTPAAAYAQLIPAFQRTTAGQGVTFTQSYGASGDQSQAVANGLHADIVAFSLSPDISALVQKKMVSPNWYKNSYRGMVTDSVVVFAVRKGNPKHVRTWDDLVKSGVSIITPNPFTSGGARWNIMAAYGAQIYQHHSKSQAIAYLTKLFDHVAVQDKSARDALQTFAGGEGDVMLAYENEAIGARQKGISLDYVIPPQTILIENPIAVTKETKFPTQANAFLKYLHTMPAQRIFGQNGYRPVRADVLKEFHFPKPHTLFTIRNLGTWPVVQSEFFDPTQGIVTKIERKKGVAP